MVTWLDYSAKGEVWGYFIHLILEFRLLFSFFFVFEGIFQQIRLLRLGLMHFYLLNSFLSTWLLFLNLIHQTSNSYRKTLK